MSHSICNTCRDGENSEFFAKHYYYIIVPSVLHVASGMSNGSDEIITILLEIITLFSTYSKEGFPLFRTIDQSKSIIQMLQNLLPRRYIDVVKAFTAILPLLMKPLPLTELLTFISAIASDEESSKSDEPERFYVRAQLYWMLLRKFEEGKLRSFTFHLCFSREVTGSLVNLYIKVHV